MKTLNLKIGAILLIVFAYGNILYAQQKFTDHKSCGLKPIKKNMFTKVPPPQKFLKEITQKRSNMTSLKVTNYIGFEDYPEAITAFEFAVDIWESILPLTIDLEIEAIFQDLGGSLGTAGPTNFYENVAGANELIPVALANTLSGRDLLPDSPEIRVRMNDFTSNDNFSWYFGTDGETPFGKFDFVTIVLHEIGHGLGITDSANFDDGENDTVSSGTNGQECNGIANNGCFNNEIVFSYDNYVELGDGTGITNLISPSISLGNALTSKDLFWNSCGTMAANGGNRPPLYAPDTWAGGSVSHLDESAFPSGTSNSLMTPRFHQAESIHSPGSIAIAMLEDIGWPFTNTCSTGPITCVGDVNVDGLINILDAYIVAQYSVELRVDGNCGNLLLGQMCLPKGDINGDCDVDILDAYHIAKCAVGLGEYCN